MTGSPVYVKVRATLSSIQEPEVLGKLISRRETVNSPRLSARPTGIVAPSLMRCLPQKLASLDVKASFMRSAAITPNQETAGG